MTPLRQGDSLEVRLASRSFLDGRLRYLRFMVTKPEPIKGVAVALSCVDYDRISGEAKVRTRRVRGTKEVSLAEYV